MHIGEIFAQESELARLGGRLLTDPYLDFPLLSAKFKLTWRCNLRCGFCRLGTRPSRREGLVELPAVLVKESLTLLRARGLRKVHYSGGEVFLYKEFRDLVSHARELGLQVNMTTNGTLLDKEAARFLVEKRVNAVNVSIDSPAEREHDAMRGSRGAWRQSWKGMARPAT